MGLFSTEWQHEICVYFKEKYIKKPHVCAAFCALLLGACVTHTRSTRNEIVKIKPIKTRDW